jgi:hypothetical protein
MLGKFVTQPEISARNKDIREYVPFHRFYGHNILMDLNPTRLG